MAGEHPLGRRWDLFYDGGRDDLRKNRATWKSYTKICQFSTVEEFWRVFHNLTDVGSLDGKRDFFLFENGIDPDWDHPGNEQGGLWLVHCAEALGADVADGAPAAKTTLDNLWQNTVLHTIGEQFQEPTESPEVVGVALNLRKTGARLAIWTRGLAGESGNRDIGQQFKKVVGLPATKRVGFARHVDSKRQASGKFLWSTFKGDVQV